MYRRGRKPRCSGCQRLARIRRLLSASQAMRLFTGSAPLPPLPPTLVQTPDCTKLVEQWVYEMATHLKSLDQNHLVTIGAEGACGTRIDECAGVLSGKAGVDGPVAGWRLPWMAYRGPKLGFIWRM